MINASNEFAHVTFGLSEDDYLEYLDKAFENNLKDKEIILKIYSKLSYEDKEKFRYIDPISIIESTNSDYCNYILMAEVKGIAEIIKSVKDTIKTIKCEK